MLARLLEQFLTHLLGRVVEVSGPAVQAWFILAGVPLFLFLGVVSLLEPGARWVAGFFFPVAVFDALVARHAFGEVKKHRRAARWRRGLCPACGYDLRYGAGRCPECGSVPDQ